MKKRNPKILVFRYRFLGDTILTIPFLKQLKQAYPESYVAVLVAPQSGVLLQNCPFVDELIEFDTTRFHKYDSGSLEKKSFWYYAQEIRKRKFDIAFVLKRSFSSAFLSWVAGIPQRIGFNTEYRGIFLTKKINFQLKQHEVINFLNHLEEPYNQAPSKGDKMFWPTPQEKSKAINLLKSLNPNQKKILIHAASANPHKMWTLNNWASLLFHLKKKNYSIILSGAPLDGQYYEEICERAEINVDLNLCETQTTLRENISVYEHCNLAICVDSGPMHLAAAVGVPILGLFGPSDPDRWSPWSNQYKIIQSVDGNLSSIKVDEVIQSVGEIIGIEPI
ncbi:MAG: lipopolysaccharide heptosyltransferase II [Candidatus Caenarcaniphilales bacterium]|nr:lipopolysaccharide heptosyltransferase II [Candidatus Caenarcaniphilales bacterium]